jgi:hypothetical protein
MKAWILISFLLLTGSCGTSNTENVQSLPTGQKIAIISLLGDKAYANYVGSTMFSFETTEIDTSTWHVDKFAKYLIAKIISKNGKFVVVPADYDRSILVDGLRRNFIPGSLDTSDVKPILSKIKEESGADLMILVVSRPTKDFVFGSDKVLEYYGIFRTSYFGLGRKTAVFAVSELAVIDGNNFDIVGWDVEAVSEGVDNDFWAESLDLLNEKQRVRLEVYIKRVIGVSLSRAIDKLNL